jgi:drug/metabolite transporter (DMT)-like permease
MSLKPSQILGMLVIVFCVICISLSSIGKNKSGPIVDEPTLPVYVPILFSLTVPVVQAANIVVAKRVTTVLKVSGRDFTFAFYFVMALVFFSYSIHSFYINEGTFDWHYF